MKKNILLVNCYPERREEKIVGYREWLQAGAAAAGLGLAVQNAADNRALPAADDFDAVIITGSQKMVGDGVTEPGLLAFVLGCRRLLLGVCYGHQALAAAFGSLVKKDGQKHLGDEEIFLNKTDALFSNFPPVFKMAESHEEIVVRDNDLERNFMVLAESRLGLVEAIRHRDLPLYGVQFHPEKSGNLGIRLLENFLHMIPK
jgi:GMP synthase-like glutamine amidotransferase